MDKIEEFTKKHLTGSVDAFDNKRKFAETSKYDQRDQKKYWEFILFGDLEDYSRYGLIDFI